ncbi:MAG: DUF1289 domain-containing protein [Pseudomonadales bacterium]|nr:DUF1289 domain-containing protein [Pseudomonadota bacterium]MDA0957473.1 DUF1289 domain-containing protein [Pseudomonadota bacterium]
MFIKSPCISVCALEGGECLGCGRTIAEIQAWPGASTEARQAILKRIAQDRQNSPSN